MNDEELIIDDFLQPLIELLKEILKDDSGT